MSTQASAAKILSEILFQGKSLSAYSFTSAILQEITYGTLRHYHELNAIFKLLQTNRTQTLDQTIHALILVGLYQLIHLSTPDYAAINETVAATKLLQKSWATAFVNAILRNFLRQKAQLQGKIKANLAAKYSHPLWLIQAIRAAYPEHWQAILLANNQRPPMHLRVNLRKISRDEYLQLLLDAGIATKPNTKVDSAIILDKPCEVTKLPGFTSGLVSVQDISAQLVANLLQLQPGQQVLDACSAPGGKTAHILELEPNLAKLVACDIDQIRLNKVQANLARLNLTCELICGDAAKPTNWWHGDKFARILLDAPCSGTGVIRRHPDIKILRQATDIPKLAKQQLRLLNALWPLLADHGRLVYATCSIMPEENTGVIKEFLRTHPQAQLELSQQILPNDHAGDGFYYAVLTNCQHD